jgi:sarcosine oxidase delta subunit
MTETPQLKAQIVCPHCYKRYELEVSPDIKDPKFHLALYQARCPHCNKYRKEREKTEST